MKTMLGVLMSIAALSVAACKDEPPPPKPKAEAKKEAAVPMPPAAPTAAPAEGVKK